ncbi:chloride channel protein [Bifidobacterium aquikefiri]|uniref:Chloride channel protein n=3 Tax=Bifidobacterium aquikefiri TaxID=1653207 RepID=A0A261G9B9_9BIFI|nr:chloride channel protein [Bifidobacterium aquikefiri]
MYTSVCTDGYRAGMRRAFKESATRFTGRIRSASHHSVSPRLLGWSIVVGVVAGFTASMFRLALQTILHAIIHLYKYVIPEQPWIVAVAVVLFAVLGCCIAALIRSDPLIKGSGIPDVEQRLRSPAPLQFPWFRVLWKKILGGILAIGPGAFAGREGPSIQIGACVGLGVSASTMTTRSYKRELVAAGAAAGLSAAFNAPIAAVLFVAEEIYSRFTLKIGLSTFAAALSANAVSSSIFGIEPVFSLPHVGRTPISAYWSIGVLAILLGVLAWAYEWTLLRSTKPYDALHLPLAVRALIPLLLTVPVGLLAPDLLGGGNVTVTTVGNGHFALWILLTFLVVRFAISQITYGSGNPGGIFLPILTLGALAGASWGAFLNLQHLWPGDTDATALMIMVGMSGLFGAVSKAPLTAIILVTEMTSYNLLMPLGFATLISYLVYDAMGGKPIYDALGKPLKMAALHPSD